MKSQKNTTKKPLFRPGDIVACWDRREIDGKETRKPIVGWIESIHTNNALDGIVYNIRWSDRLEQEKIMRVTEDQMPPLRNLVDMIRAGEIK